MTKNTGVTETITISIEEYNRLRNSALWEEALDTVGVDNWEGYNDAISIYQEWKND